jgi:two-component sensor histidine kinase
MNVQQLRAFDSPGLAHSAPGERPRSQADEIALLVAEANHRIRNLLAAVEAIVRQTRSDTVEEYRTKVLSRISGFSDFYQVTAPESGKHVLLGALLKQAVASYYWERGQVFAAGPDVTVPPDVALALHLVFHELAMNAIKYGALAAAPGYVTIDWKLCASTTGGNPKVALVWKEQGGPIVRPPVRSGFGSRLIRRAFDGIGEVEIAFKETGVHCFMLIDLNRG